MRCEVRKFFANYVRREVFFPAWDSKFRESTNAFHFFCNAKFIFLVDKYQFLRPLALPLDRERVGAKRPSTKVRGNVSGPDRRGTHPPRLYRPLLRPRAMERLAPALTDWRAGFCAVRKRRAYSRPYHRSSTSRGSVPVLAPIRESSQCIRASKIGLPNLRRTQPLGDGGSSGVDFRVGRRGQQ